MREREKEKKRERGREGAPVIRGSGQRLSLSGFLIIIEIFLQGLSTQSCRQMKYVSSDPRGLPDQCRNHKKNNNNKS